MNEPQNQNLVKRCCNYSMLEEKIKEYILAKQISELKEEAASTKDESPN